MKKILCMSLALVSVLNACSADDNNSVTLPKTLPVPITEQNREDVDKFCVKAMSCYNDAYKGANAADQSSASVKKANCTAVYMGEMTRMQKSNCADQYADFLSCYAEQECSDTVDFVNNGTASLQFCTNEYTKVMDCIDQYKEDLLDDANDMFRIDIRESADAFCKHYPTCDSNFTAEACRSYYDPAYFAKAGCAYEANAAMACMSALSCEDIQSAMSEDASEEVKCKKEFDKMNGCVMMYQSESMDYGEHYSVGISLEDSIDLYCSRQVDCKVNPETMDECVRNVKRAAASSEKVGCSSNFADYMFCAANVLKTNCLYDFTDIEDGEQCSAEYNKAIICENEKNKAELSGEEYKLIREYCVFRGLCRAETVDLHDCVWNIIGNIGLPADDNKCRSEELASLKCSIESRDCSVLDNVSSDDKPCKTQEAAVVACYEKL